MAATGADRCSTGDDEVMRLTYPPVSKTSFSDAALAFKIARHTPCSACDTCLGLRPPPDVDVVLSDDDSRKSSLGVLDQYGSDEDDEPAYLCTCTCGHEVADHGADESAIGREEFSRRGRLAVRLDEMLQASLSVRPVFYRSMLPFLGSGWQSLYFRCPVWSILTDEPYSFFLQEVDKLLDFGYSDDDIFSLRQQMKLPVSLISTHSPSLGKICRHYTLINCNLQTCLEHSSPLERPHSPGSSILSDGDEPPTKRRRVSLSSLSDEEDEEEEKPLAAQVSQPQQPDTPARKSNKRAGKKTSSMKSKSQTAPTSSKQPDVNGVNGHVPDAKVKVEDKMDESQLTRLATGVTVDAGPSSTTHVSHVWPVHDPWPHDMTSFPAACENGESSVCRASERHHSSNSSRE